MGTGVSEAGQLPVSSPENHPRGPVSLHSGLVLQLQLAAEGDRHPQWSSTGRGWLGLGWGQGSGSRIQRICGYAALQALDFSLDLLDALPVGLHPLLRPQPANVQDRGARHAVQVLDLILGPRGEKQTGRWRCSLVQCPRQDIDVTEVVLHVI